MKTSEHILHIAKLSNNCPECYSNEGLEISFVQEELENRFYSKSQNSIIETIFCKNCAAQIAGVRNAGNVGRRSNNPSARPPALSPLCCRRVSLGSKRYGAAHIRRSNYTGALDDVVEWGRSKTG